MSHIFSSIKESLVSVNAGYSDDVMQAAKKAGETGGTVINGTLADIGQFAELPDITADEEREILLILAPFRSGQQIMGEVNKQFGLTSKANGMTFAIPTEKAYKI